LIAEHLRHLLGLNLRRNDLRTHGGVLGCRRRLRYAKN